MGHVDHGKHLLDYIRESNVIAGEAEDNSTYWFLWYTN